MPVHATRNSLLGAHGIRGIPLFAELSAEEAAEMELLILKKRFSKGEVVLLEEDTSRYMYIIYSGKVKVVQVSDDGKERILAFHKKNDFFGELSLLDGKTSPATVIAIENSEIGLLSKEDFHRFVFGNEQILRRFINTLCSRLRESWQMLRIMNFADAEERVRAVLKNMISLYGVREQRGTLITIKLTHREIANYAAVSRETASRLLKRFATEGEIEMINKKYILVKNHLKKQQL